MPPEERAWAIWASLRVRNIDPLDVLSACLAVELRHDDDPYAERQEQYREVQMAKVLHRMAGGTHKRWQQPGRAVATELHVHPHSRGSVLRYVGREARQAVLKVYPMIVADRAL